MKVSEAIEILESKVLRSEENLKHFPKESQGYAANEARIIAYNIAINTLQHIDEPQKVKVPAYVAEWFETNKYVLDRAILDYMFEDYASDNSEFGKWFDNKNGKPIETLVRMLDGYEVAEIMDQKILDVGLLLLHLTDKNLI